LPIHLAVASSDSARRRATLTAAELSARLRLPIAQGHVRSLLHEVAFVARFAFDEKQALSNASSAALLSCTVRLRSLTEEDWARLSGIPLRQRRELARCEISGAC
jgi:hypothetical protein